MVDETEREESFECSICGEITSPVVVINHFSPEYVHPGSDYSLSSSVEGRVLEVRGVEEAE